MRAERLLSILMVLQARSRATAQELAEQLEVSERTIYRDVDALSAAGIPIYADRGPGGGFALLEGYSSRLTGLTDEETRSLLLATVSKPLADLGLDRPLRDAILKLTASLPASLREETERDWSLLHLDPGPWFHAEEPVPHLPVVRRAVWNSRRLRIRYRRPGVDLYDRVIEPYGLVVKANIWYVVANTPNGMRFYRVSRIVEASLTGESFTRPPDFNLAAFWEAETRSFEESRFSYRVVARFAPDVQPDLPAMFGASMRNLMQAAVPDAAGWMILPATYDDEEYACKHLLGLGRRVEVLEPIDLREKIAYEIQEMQALYAGAV
ncbi:MAG: YafY family transcriptional regulator [Chloroflexi bacterium]|nr:YafY family transcriptional regulator [Chloroflexota bacterium]